MHLDPTLRTRRRIRLTSSWLAIGCTTLLLTPVPMHTHALGWSPLIWLVLAPAALLIILEPRLPAQWARHRHWRFLRAAEALPVRQKVRRRRHA